MVNYHSEFVYPLGAFQGRQEEEWGSFRARDHFEVDLGSGSFRGLCRPRL